MNEKIKKPAPIEEKQDQVSTLIKLARENKHFGIPKHVEIDCYKSTTSNNN